MNLMANEAVNTQSEMDISQALDSAAASLMHEHMAKNVRKDYIRKQLEGGLENIMLYKTQVKWNVVYYV